MTEDEWLTGAEPRLMLEFLRGKVSDRKLRLFAVACFRRILPMLCDELCRSFVNLVENHLDGKVEDEVLRVAWVSINDLARDLETYLSRNSQERVDATRAIAAIGGPGSDSDLLIGLNSVSEYAAAAIADIAVPERWESDNMEHWTVAHAEERSVHCDLLRDIFGNPFRPVVADPAWLTPTVVSIADAIYRDCAFDRLPILADALEEAGCTNADLLLHCRQPGEHVRGCWAVDLVLGKE